VKEKATTAKPANEVITGFGVGLSGVAAKNRSPTASVSQPFREAIELGLSHGRNAKAIWQDPGDRVLLTLRPKQLNH